jgi:hypothetical protein
MKSLFVKTVVNTWVVVFIFCINPKIVSAQVVNSTKEWNFLADVYLMFPYMNGETGIGNHLTVPVDASPSDIFSKLKIAGMFYLEAKTGKWAITSDFVYMKLDQELTPGNIIESGDVIATQLIWEPAGLYRILPFWEIGMGGRLNNIGTEIDVLRKVIPTSTESINESASKMWFDPILITRLTGDIHDKWLFQFRGDFGGFGVGSDFTWQLQAYAGYRFSKVFQLTAGYRILGVNYDKGSNADRFIYKVDTFGPVLRMGFNF